MNWDTPEQRAEYVKKQMAGAVDTLRAACGHLKRKFEVKEEFDGEQLLVEVDDIPFYFTWSEQIKRGSFGGGLRWTIAFQLWTFYQTRGGRLNPPETVDVELLTGVNGVNPCVKKALETVAMNEINGALENVSYEQMATEEM